MRWLALVTLFGIALSVQAESDSRSILVGGTGWVEAVPDMLSLNLSLRATGQDVEKLQSQVERTAQQVMKAAGEQGIATADMDSSQASVRPEFEWRDGKRIYRGQVVQRDIALTLRDLQHYGPLLQVLSRLDIQSIGEPQMGHSQLAALQLDAIEAALGQAAAKAQRMATTLELELGAVISAEEQLATRPVAPAGLRMSMEASAAPDIQFGKQRISASVTVRYAISD